MISSNKYRVIYIIGICCVLVPLFYFINIMVNNYHLQKNMSRINCSASFTVQTEIKTNGLFSLITNGEGHGRIHISALALRPSDNEKFKLLRDIDFEYLYEGDGYLAMRSLTVSKIASDNMPDDIFNKSIFDVSGNIRRIRITELKNGYVLWNAFSPVLICLQKH